MRVALFGATAKTGRPLAAALAADGHRVIAAGRDAGRLAEVEGAAETRIADLETGAGLAAAMAGTDAVVSLAHARYIETILGALPAACKRVVVTGSTRKFTRFPDTAADAVRAGEAAFEAFTAARGGEVCATLLHPTMIYGAPGERNISRMRRLVRRWPGGLPVVLPLPGGGRNTVQPVHFSDVVAAFAAALTADGICGEAIVLAGPAPVTYRALVTAVGAAEGRRVSVLPVPAGLLSGAAALMPVTFGPAEIRRATEDKAFDVHAMTRLLGRAPITLTDGLARQT